jgi:adenylyltransferase/sulfurtransferase
MLIFDGLEFQTRIIKLRPKQTECIMCSLQEKKTLDILEKFDYNQFCGVVNYNDKTLHISLLDSATQRISCPKYKEISTSDSHLLIDCRPQHEFQICSLPNSISEYTLLFF